MTTQQPKHRAMAYAIRFGLGLFAAAGLAAFISVGSAERASAEFITPHGGNTTTTAVGCAACHTIHRDQADTFTPDNTVPRSLACLGCHDGTGANTSIAAQYNTASPNDADTRTYYSHPANATGTGHLSPAVDDEGGFELGVNEFEGVHNRHSDCVDCHNPHGSATAPGSSKTNNGWTLSGSMKDVSVVAAAFPADPSVAPTYTFIARGTDTNYEYELCLKCHSSFTTLSSNDGWAPSKWYLDFGRLINPNNTSFHPITAAGKNKTLALGNNLAGDPDDTYHMYTTFNVNSVIACTSCHGRPGGGTHATGNPGILAFRYRSENLKLSTESYNVAEFKLCFTCHSDIPFQRVDSTYTNFSEHYGHMVTYKGTGTAGGTVNDDGNGDGVALCSECHWNSHSSGQSDAAQTLSGMRLVQFAPNVQPYGGKIEYITRNGSTPGSCTLVCHGYTHNATAYGPLP